MGLTQSHLAASVGISSSYMNLIEHDKRPISGALLAKLARALDLDLDSLTGAHEARLIQTLSELATDPVLNRLDAAPEDTADLVARFPQWSRGILALYRGYVDACAQINALSDRLGQDSLMMDISHQMLTHITSIRSSAEILQDFADLDEGQRQRFLSVVSGESSQLADAARSLFTVVETASSSARSLTPIEEVDDFLIDNQNYFPALETGADKLRKRLGSSDAPSSAALLDYLQERRGIIWRSIDDGSEFEDRLVNGCWFDRDGSTFYSKASLPPTTIRFQAARLFAELEAASLVADHVNDKRLHSPEARKRAARALTSYLAGALLFPYEPFYQAAQNLRYDIDALGHRFGGSFEQICHRLVTLRRENSSGIPFAFMRTDPAGNVTKRFSIPGLTLPRYGTACPLWAIYRTLQAPSQTITQLAQLPDGSMFLLIARAITRQPPAHGQPGTAFSIMIACESIYADRIVHADGLDPARVSLVTPVGTACRLCPRKGCTQRAHEAVLSIQ